MTTKTEAEITEQLESDGWELLYVLTDAGDYQTESSWSVTLKRTIPTFGGRAVGGYLEPRRGDRESFTTKYSKGCAHRIWKGQGRLGVMPFGMGSWVGILPKQPKIGERVPQLFGSRTMAQQQLLEDCTEPEPPTLDEVLWSLLMDSSGVRDGQTFEDWCGDYGSDTDSIKARKTFDACRDEWAALIRLGADFDTLDALFQDY